MQTSRRPGTRVTPLGGSAVLVAVVGWSFANVLVKLTSTPGLTFTFYRLWLGALAMLIVLRVTGRRLTWRMVRASVLGGVLFGLDLALFISSLKATSVADVLVIQALQPALVLMVAGRLFGERVTRYDVVWTLVSVAGVVVVAIGSSGTPVWSAWGDLLSVAALLVWTGYFLVSKRARATVPATEYMTTVTIVGAIVATPVVLASGQPLGGVRWQDWAWLLVFLAAAQGGHVLVAWAHAQVDVSISSLFVLAQPVIASVAALFILGEPLTIVEMVGGLVVVASVGAIVGRAAAASRREPGEGDDIATAEVSPT